MNKIWSLILVSTCTVISNANNGDYFGYYNQSSFSWSGDPRDQECKVTASYSVGGAGYNWNAQCKFEGKQWESQQAFDLQYYEVEKVCPALTRLPDEFKNIPYDNEKNNIPSELIWTDRCVTYSKDTYCPRFQCDKNDTNSEWDPDFEQSFTYKEITTLSFSSTPLRSYCYVCRCEQFTNAQTPLSWSDDRVWAWDCTDENININGTDITLGERWDINPIDDENYDVLIDECKAPTPSPTVSPTDNPVSRATPQPTGFPTVTTCTNDWGTTYAAGSYYWESTDGCSTIQFCLCQAESGQYCKIGWSQIMSDPLLYPGFLLQCGEGDDGGNYLSECWEPSDANRLFGWYDYANNPTRCFPSANNFCPRCGCTTDPFNDQSRTNTSFNTTTFGEIKNTSVAVADYEYLFWCAECTCILGETDFGLVSYVPTNTYSTIYDATIECEFYDDTNNDEQMDCIARGLRCYEHEGTYDPFAGNTVCSQQRTTADGFQDYCTYDQTTISSKPDEICVEHYTENAPAGSWGCEQTYYCELLGEPGCYTANYDYKLFQYDCLNDEWVSDTYSAKQFKSCCNDGNNCNNRTIEDYGEDKCSSSSVLKEFNQYGMQCAYSQKNIYSLTNDKNFIRAAFCGDSLDYEDYADDPESLCDLLKVKWQTETLCDCNSARMQIAAFTEANDGAGIKDGDFLINSIKSDFWTDSRYIDDAWTTYSAAAYRLQTMFDYWQCSDFEKDSEAPSFFDCDFDAEVDSINNRDSTRNIFSSSIFVNIFGIIGITLVYNKHTNIFFMMMCLFMMQMFMTHGYVGNSVENWYRTGGGSYGDCEFRANVATNNDDVCRQTSFYDRVYQDEDLTWDILVDACPQLKYTGCYTESQQIDMKKLVWPNYDNQCNGCPRCPCNNETDTLRHYVDERYDVDTLGRLIDQYCFECECSYWSDAEEWAWTCYDSSKSWYYDGNANDPYVVMQSDPYSVNDTYFCIPTPNPTSAPTPDSRLSCVTGTDFDGLTPSNNNEMSGYFGYSHCGWLNASVARYDDGEPAVCVYDEVEGEDLSADIVPILTPQWFRSSNDEPVCLAIAGDESGCYYAEFDFGVKAFDCALDEWVSDTYSMEATIFCCNDGDYCNNQTMTIATREKDPMVEYISGEYMNETMTAKCKRSGKFEEYLRIAAGCEYNDYGTDAEYNRASKCRGGVSNVRPTCNTLNNYWKETSKCRCDKYEFFKRNVNDTYDDYLDSYFDAYYSGTADQLAVWNKSLGCGYGWTARWNAYGVAKCNGVSLPFNLSIIAALVVIISFMSN